uniref:HPS4 biogenesis of lysosomal organelles complex 3 subunit 2 n=1 Tax=Salarias fasciatus TaxID=181472 RepID=A0A672JEB2_SALFA
MAEFLQPDSRRCSYFFLYDGSKVRGEGDPTRDGICYFYPEETPLDKQELLCGQLAGVARCVSELSSSPVRTLRLRRIKFSIHMKDDFLWALGCSMDVPTVSVCELLDQLISLFCFYSGPVRHSYQLNSQRTLAERWARYLSHLQLGSSALHHIFSSLRTIDSTNVDPLLLLKAALILQACQRCPLVLAGCILFRGRVVSTQMTPELTMKIMVYESETYSRAQRPNGPSSSGSSGGSVSSTNVFLTPSELQCLQSAPVDKDHRYSRRFLRYLKTRLSRTLSDTPSSESDPSDPNSPPVFSPAPSVSSSDSPRPSSRSPPFSNGQASHEAEGEPLDRSYYHSFHSNGDGAAGDSGPERRSPLNGGGRTGAGAGGTGAEWRDGDRTPPPPPPGASETSREEPLVPMTLYMHRVKGLVLALLVEPPFLNDTASMEEVYHSSLASLNGLEAHLRTISPGAPGGRGPYVFAHFDLIQRTLTSNLSGRAGGAPEHSFVRATSLLHSHFCNTETLQEAIIRSAGEAVYGTRSVAQETYFQQHGVLLRNSGIPNHQDSAFSLPAKARSRLLKHGVNLL